MSNVSSFAVKYAAKHGSLNMRQELERRHEAERQLIAAGDPVAFHRLMARVDSAIGLPYVPENDDMKELLLARFGAMP